jgi:hypothetical protein
MVLQHASYVLFYIEMVLFGTTMHDERCCVSMIFIREEQAAEITLKSLWWAYIVNNIGYLGWEQNIKKIPNTLFLILSELLLS